LFKEENKISIEKQNETNKQINKDRNKHSRLNNRLIISHIQYHFLIEINRFHHSMVLLIFSFLFC